MAVITNNLPTSDITPMTDKEWEITRMVTQANYSIIRVFTHDAQEVKSCLEAAGLGVDRDNNISKIRKLMLPIS